MADLKWRKGSGCCPGCFVLAIAVSAFLLESGSRSRGSPSCRLQGLLVTWVTVAASWSTPTVTALTPPPPPAPASSDATTPLPPIPSRSGGIEAFIQAISDRVNLVADAAKANHDNACDTLQKCSSQSAPRLRLSCGYREGEKFNCTEGFQFNTSVCYPNGTDEVGRKCDSLWVSYEEPFIRYPSVEASDLQYDFINQTIFQHTCIQSPLRTTFSASLNEEGYMSAGLLYYGSMAGTFISFPGMNYFKTSDRAFPFDCEEFDPRMRPWFAEAASPKKRVSILVDLTSGMQAHISWAHLNDLTTRLDFLKRTLYSLARTFRTGDTITLTTVPEGYDVDSEEVLGIDHPARCMKFKASVDKMKSNLSSYDTTEGIRRALKKLETMPNTENEPEMLLIFTRSGINIEIANYTINTYNSNRWTKLPVFLYGVDITEPSTTIFENMTKVAENVAGIARNMGQADPLLAIYSYFNFLSQFYANVTHPFWAKQYKDEFNTGNTTTHIKPVYDSQGRFLGVAAMDVRDQPNSASFLQVAHNQSSTVKGLVPTNLRDALNVSNCSFPCYDGYESLSCSGRLKAENVVLERTVEVPEMLKCCGSCSIIKPPPCQSSPLPSWDTTKSSAYPPPPRPSSNDNDDEQGSGSSKRSVLKPVVETVGFKVGIAVVAAVVVVACASLAIWLMWDRCEQNTKKDRSREGGGTGGLEKW